MLTTALAIARRLPWRYIGPAMLAAVVLFAAYGAGAKNERAKWQPRLDLATRERDTARANVATLEDAIARQNAAIADAAGKTRAAQDKAADAARKAQERGRKLAGVKAQLADASRAVPAQAGCAVPDAVVDAWRRF